MTICNMKGKSTSDHWKSVRGQGKVRLVHTGNNCKKINGFLSGLKAIVTSRKVEGCFQFDDLPISNLAEVFSPILDCKIQALHLIASYNDHMMLKIFRNSRKWKAAVFSSISQCTSSKIGVI